MYVYVCGYLCLCVYMCMYICIYFSNLAYGESQVPMATVRQLGLDRGHIFYFDCVHRPLL